MPDPNPNSLPQLISEIAEACVAVDRAGSGHRRVGQYDEPELVRSVAEHLNRLSSYSRGAESKHSPDILVPGLWALDLKIVHPYGDSGREIEDWSVKILHPDSDNASMIGDCLHLAAWQGPERRAAVAIGFEHDPARTPLGPLFRAFEAIAAQQLPFAISPRCEAVRCGLGHPVHQVVRVAAWEVPPLTA